MSTISFQAKSHKIGTWTVLRLPKSASAKLPTRGMTMVDGTINSTPFKAPLEPDGTGSHWFKADKAMQKAGAKAGATVTVVIEPAEEWSEPKAPADLKQALGAARKAHDVWTDITPKARWEWIRWIRSTKNPETRTRRIEVAISKLRAGNRRPCCFNSSECTIPQVSDKGMLVESK